MKTDPRFKDRHAIKAAIHRAGSTLKAISIAAGLEPSACKVALHRPHRAGELAIAQFFGIKPSTIFSFRDTPSHVDPTSASKPESTSATSPIGEGV